MGLISTIFGGGVGAVADGVGRVAEVFTPNAEKQAARNATRFTSVQQAYSAEYGGHGWFNQLVDGLNRLPRPMIAYGVIALFFNAMIDPISFGARMVGLQAIPEQMWWLIGAVVSFYFGSRELHKMRAAKPVSQIVKEIKQIESLRVRDDRTPGAAQDASPEVSMAISSGKVTASNAAIEEWKMRQGQK